MADPSPTPTLSPARSASDPAPPALAPAPNGKGAEPQAGSVTRPGLIPPSGEFDQTTFLSDVIVALGIADEERVETALQAARNPGHTFEATLLESEVLSERQLARALSERHGVEQVELALFGCDPEASGLIPTEVAGRYEAIPIGFADDGTLLVAMTDPGDWLAAKEVSELTGHEVRPVAAPRTALLDYIGNCRATERAKAPTTGRSSSSAPAPAPAPRPVAPTPTGEPRAERPAPVAAPHPAPDRVSALDAPLPQSAPSSTTGGGDASFEAFQRWMLERWVSERESRLEAERAELERQRAELERERAALQRQQAAFAA